MDLLTQGKDITPAGSNDYAGITSLMTANAAPCGSFSIEKRPTSGTSNGGTVTCAPQLLR